MTTHEHPARTASLDESPAALADTPPASEHAAPTAPPDPATAPDDLSPASSASPHFSDEQPHPDPSPSAPAGHTQPEGTQHPPAERQISDEDLLFADDELADLRTRWTAVQAAFVDDPKQCVEKADSLVTDLVDQLTSGFAQARSRLEEQWARGEEASTEDLRVALMHYREFFERLLAV
jgi:hypothetical protein